MKWCVLIWLFYMAVNLQVVIHEMYLVHPYRKTSSYNTVHMLGV